MILDLHCHTIKGGPDSNLNPDQLVEEARRVGLDGVCLTEHGGGWEKWDFQRFASQHPDLVLIRALEVDTEMGHITTFGLDGYVGGIHRIENLRKVIDDVGGFMVAVHPFRRYFDKPPLFRSLLFKNPVPLEEAIKHPIFELTDAIEVVNGANNDIENDFALQAAQALGKSHVGGSDAHSTHGLGCAATVFERDIRTVQDLIGELKAGRFYATDGLPKGHREPYGSNGKEDDGQASV